jgi:hypothetical protein
MDQNIEALEGPALEIARANWHLCQYLIKNSDGALNIDKLTQLGYENQALLSMIVNEAFGITHLMKEIHIPFDRLWQVGLENQGLLEEMSHFPPGVKSLMTEYGISLNQIFRLTANELNTAMHELDPEGIQALFRNQEQDAPQPPHHRPAPGRR